MQVAAHVVTTPRPLAGTARTARAAVIPRPARKNSAPQEARRLKPLGFFLFPRSERLLTYARNKLRNLEI